MKLLSLTTRIHLLSIVVVMSMGGVASFYILKNIVNHEFNEKLYADRQQFLYEWHTYDNIEEVLYLNIGDRIEVIPLKDSSDTETMLIDTLMWDNYENKELPFRQLRFVDSLEGEPFQITITKSLLPTLDLVQGVGEIILLLTISVVLTFTYVNRKISKKIWAPFYDTVNKLEDFRVTESDKIEFEQTKITEFKELNRKISEMIKKSRQDYFSLKEFTENASHEIQTPLAIIKNKAELLLQSSSLAETELNEISKIYDAATRLSKLNTSLSMLAKIDNHQFHEVEPIEMVPFLEKKLSHYEELIALKKITVTKRFNANPKLLVNNTMAFVLINNLLNNAIKHNVKKGTLNISLDINKLIIENTGQPMFENPETYFERFKKSSTSSESSGLGMALIKRICDMYEMPIHYTVTGDIHKIEILF